jgi:hypothetical protein
MSENDIRTLLGSAVTDAPVREFSTPAIASAAADRTRRRRAWYGVGAVGAAAAVTGVTALSLNLLGSPVVPKPVAAAASSATAGAGQGPATGISVASSLPLGEVVTVVDQKLPSGTSVGELAVDAAFTPEGALTLRLVTPSGPADLALTASAAGCSASSSALGQSTLDAISAAICTAASAYPNQPGTVLPGSGSVDPAA